MGFSYVLTFILYTVICMGFGYILCMFVQMIREKAKEKKKLGVKKDVENK